VKTSTTEFAPTTRLIPWIALFSLLLAAVLTLDVFPWLRGDYGWRWPYARAPWERIALLAAVTTAYVAGGLWLAGRRSARGLLLWTMIGTVALTIAVILLRHDDPLFTLFARTASPLTTGTHYAAAGIDWNSGEWRDWPTYAATLRGPIAHVPIAPPALPMLYGLANAIFGVLPDALPETLRSGLLPYQCHNYHLLAYTPEEWASAWIGVLMPLWAALALFPLYSVTRRLAGEEAARLAALLFPLIPALLVFAPGWNTIYPLLSLSAFWALDVGLSARRRSGWLILAGLLAGVCIFVNFAFVPMVMFFGFYTLARWGWIERHDARVSPAAPVIAGLWFGLGLIVPWLLYTLISGPTFFDLLGAAMGEHLELERPYLPWLWLHFWDWALWTGVPLILIWLAAALSMLIRRGTGGDRPSSAQVMAAALAVSMLALIVSGTARGETGRVWLLFAPFALIAAAATIRRSQWIALVVAQAALMIVLASTLDAIGTDLIPPPNAPASIADAQPVSADFGGFRLIGWSGAEENGSITLALNWQAETRSVTPYWFSALLVDPSGGVAGEALWQPDDGAYPVSCWVPGAVIGDQITIALPENAEPGAWWISLAAFDASQSISAPGEEGRLNVTLADGSTDGQIGLGPVMVEVPSHE
jgi:hypothetical protein